MNLKDKLKENLKDAMREKDVIKRDSIRSINTMIKQREVDERINLNDDDIIGLIRKGIKLREDAKEQYINGKRQDLVDKEQAQIDIFQAYLPKALSQEVLQKSIADIIKEVQAKDIKDMGKVMAKAKEAIGSKSDGKSISEEVKKQLSK